VIPTGVLVADRNAKGRFDAGLVTSLSSASDRVLMAGVCLAGLLKPSS
jgi:hypothetical protein